MSDITGNPPVAPESGISGKGSLLREDARTKRRNAAERRFQLYGKIAIGIGLVMLLTLVFNIVTRGVGAYQQTFMTVDISSPVSSGSASASQWGQRFAVSEISC